MNSLRDDLEEKESQVNTLTEELEVCKDYLEETEQSLGKCQKSLLQADANLEAARQIIALSNEKEHCMALHDTVVRITTELEAEKANNQELNKQISEVKELALKRILHQDSRVHSAKREAAQLSLELHQAREGEIDRRQRTLELEHALSLSMRTANICIKTCQEILGPHTSGVCSRDARRVFRELSRLHRIIAQQSTRSNLPP